MFSENSDKAYKNIFFDVLKYKKQVYVNQLNNQRINKMCECTDYKPNSIIKRIETNILIN